MALSSMPSRISRREIKCLPYAIGLIAWASLFFTLRAPAEEPVSKTCELQYAATLGPTEEEFTRLKLYDGNFLRLAKINPEEAAARNNSVFTKLRNEGFPAFTRSRKKMFLSFSEMQELLAATIKNKQVKESLCGSYNGSPAGIGFCWGRAMAVHLKAILPRGSNLHNKSVRKLWAVGHFHTPGNPASWDFHVTTIVRGENGAWYAIDPFFDKPLLAEEWYARLKSTLDPDGTMRIFTSPASRFIPQKWNKYNKQDMANIFYYNFFTDLMDTIFKENTGENGPMAALAKQQNSPTLKSKMDPLLLSLGLGGAGAAGAFAAIKAIYGETSK